MKNKRFLACLLACICCFQSGACIPVIAEDSNPAVTEATENLSEIQQACKQIREKFDLDCYTITCDEEQNTIQIIVTGYEEWVHHIKKFCQEKGFTRKYDIRFYLQARDGEIASEPTAKDYQEMSDDIKKIKEFIRTNITEEYEEMPHTLIAFNDWFKTIMLQASTQENADKLKAFCEESGLAEKYKISYDVRYQTDYTVIPELNQAVSQIQQFANEKKISPPEDWLDVAFWENIYDNNAFRHVIGFCITVITETQEELDTIKAYCEEQGFTDEYEFVFEVYQEPVTEIVTDFTAGDVTMDDSVDILDVITVNKAVLGKEILSTVQNKLADINRDGKVDSSDALEILKQVVGLTE